MTDEQIDALMIVTLPIWWPIATLVNWSKYKGAE